MDASSIAEHEPVVEKIDQEVTPEPSPEQVRDAFEYTTAVKDIKSFLEKRGIVLSFTWNAESDHTKASLTVGLLHNVLAANVVDPGMMQVPEVIFFEDQPGVHFNETNRELSVGLGASEAEMIEALKLREVPDAEGISSKEALEKQRREKLSLRIKVFYHSLTDGEREKIAELFWAAIEEPEKGQVANDFLSSRLPRGSLAFKFEKGELPNADRVENVSTVEAAAYFNAESLRITVKEGDTLWSIAENILKTDDEFGGLDEAQQAYVIGTVTSEILNDPRCGLSKGALEVGKIIDLSSVLNS